jgi:hypothetical protein
MTIIIAPSGAAKDSIKKFPSGDKSILLMPILKILLS